MSPPRSGDDIPLARRSQRPRARRSGGLGSLAWLLLGSGLLALAIPALLRSPLGSGLLPPPVAGLNARLSPDGRLLGHYAYPEADSGSLVAIGGGLQLRADAARALQAMRQAAAADGVDLVVLSAFRSIALQRQLFFDVMAERNQSSRERARVSAPPGFSEHSTGFAVDLGDGREPATNLSASFERTAAYRWLAAHAARYHFALSFPTNNSQGVSYEPWHWRYEGSTEALTLFERAQRLAR